MVGIFSRFSGGRSGHRRNRSTTVVREISPQNFDVAATTPPSATPRIGTVLEFKPVMHPSEPLDYDQPVICPLPEPSILNDRRIWKERMSSVSRRMMSDLHVVKERSQIEPDVAGTKPQAELARKCITLPSLSAPEPDFIDLLEECNLTGDRTVGC